MKTYIALFRGINVVGSNILLMKELAALLGNLDCHNVKTYIQSGNAVFQSDAESASQLSSRISAEIKRRHGFEPRVLLMSIKNLEKAVESNPFPEAESEPKSLHVNFMVSVPENPDLKALENLRKKSERFELRGNLFYLHAPEGIGRSKLAANAERLLGVPMTGRNWRTVCKIMAMAKEYN